MITDNSFYEFEKIYNELKDKKISELSMKDIGKFLLVEEELRWVDENKGDDKFFCKYDKDLLDSLSSNFSDSVFRLINEELLYDNDLHTESSKNKLEEDYEM